MKEAIGGVSLFQIVIVFLLAFTGVMCLTINHSKAFGVKDEIINVIENDMLANSSETNSYKLNEETVENIINHLNEGGHRITGNCPDGDWIGYDRNKAEVTENAAFCIRAVDVGKAYHSDIEEKCSTGKCEVTSNDFPSMVYYDVILFYQLDVPVLNKIMNFQMRGSTKIIFGTGDL